MKLEDRGRLLDGCHAGVRVEVAHWKTDEVSSLLELLLVDQSLHGALFEELEICPRILVEQNFI